jgi:cytochrome b561
MNSHPYRTPLDMIAIEPAMANTAPMPLRRPPFDSFTIWLHWATALIVLAMFATAWLRSLSHDDALRATLLQAHRSLGLTIWVMTCFRLVWRVTNATMPPFPPTITDAHRRLVRWSECGLYAMLFVQPLTGLGATLFNGRPFALFAWRFAPLLSENRALSGVLHLAHECGAWAFAALVAGHAGAALVHHFVLRDDVLECMAPAIAPARHPEALEPAVVLSEKKLEASELH